MQITLANTTIEIPPVPLGVTKRIILKLNDFNQSVIAGDDSVKLLEIAVDCIAMATGKSQEEVEEFPIGIDELAEVVEGIAGACGLLKKPGEEGKAQAAK